MGDLGKLKRCPESNKSPNLVTLRTIEAKNGHRLEKCQRGVQCDQMLE